MTRKRQSCAFDNRVRPRLDLLEERRAPSANVISIVEPAMPDTSRALLDDAVATHKIGANEEAHSPTFDLIRIERGDVSSFELVVAMPHGQQLELGFSEIRDGNSNEFNGPASNIRLELAVSNLAAEIGLENTTTRSEPPSQLANRIAAVKAGSVLIDADHEPPVHKFGEALGGDVALELSGAIGPHSPSGIENRPIAPLAPWLSGADALAPLLVGDAAHFVAATDARSSAQFATSGRSTIQPAADADSTAFADPGSTPDIRPPDYPTPASAPELAPALDFSALPPPSINASDVVSHFAPLDPKSIEESIARFIGRLQNGHDSGRSWLSFRRIAVLSVALTAGLIGLKIGQRRGLSRCLARALSLSKRQARRHPSLND